jgi:hypothetical protein
LSASRNSSFEASEGKNKSTAGVLYSSVTATAYDNAGYAESKKNKIELDCKNDVGIWYICDTDGNPVKPAPVEIQEKIEGYIKSLPDNINYDIKNTDKNEDALQRPITFLPLITVITVVFNGVKTLEETIKSVINQTYLNVEYIIIDGGSTDGTLDIIKKYEDTIDYWVSESDNGIYDAWNKAINVFMGSYAAFLGSGDVYSYEAISLYVDYILIYGDVDYISSKIELYDKKKLEPLRIIGSKWEWNKFRKFMNVAHVGSLHYRKLFLNSGLFNIEYKIAGDYEFLMRSADNLRAGFVNKVTVKMDINGISHNSYKVFFETARLKDRFASRNRLAIYFEMIIAILKTFLRKILWY